MCCTNATAEPKGLNTRGYAGIYPSEVDTLKKVLPDVRLMLVHRLRRCPNIKPTLVEDLVFAE